MTTNSTGLIHHRVIWTPTSNPALECLRKGKQHHRQIPHRQRHVNVRADKSADCFGFRTLPLRPSSHQVNKGSANPSNRLTSQLSDG